MTKFISKQNYFGTAGGFNSNDSLQHDTNTNWFFGLHNPRKVLNLDPYYFKGKVDDIRMYNRSLDSTEIKSLFNEPDNNKPTGIEEINNSKVVIYPNPSTEAIKINGINKGSVRILDLNGQLLQVHDYNINDEIKHQLPSGYYFLQILTEGKTINKKLIIN